MEYIKFRHPFTCMVSGPTSSGKTFLVRDILKNFKSLIDIAKPKLNVLWAYGQWQSLYTEPIADNVSVDYVNGLPMQDEISGHDIIIIDDLMTELGNNKDLSALFTKGSHHQNLSVIFITQNFYHQASQMRTLHVNSHYIIMMNSPRGKSSLRHLGSDLFANRNFLVNAYEDATKEPFSYIRIDLTQQTPDKYRITTNLVPKPYFKPVFYIPT